jgi:hypothetical protein
LELDQGFGQFRALLELGQFAGELLDPDLAGILGLLARRFGFQRGLALLPALLAPDGQLGGIESVPAQPAAFVAMREGVKLVDQGDLLGGREAPAGPGLESGIGGDVCGHGVAPEAALPRCLSRRSVRIVGSLV